MRHYLVAGLVLLATAAPAQILPTSPGRQRAAERRALREAHQAEAPYKESHLAVTRQQMRRGGSEQLARTPHEPRFARDGTPQVARSLFPGRRRRRAKNEPKP